MCIPVFWTGVSCLVDWFFSALSLSCFDASTDTLVRVSNTTALLFRDKAACIYLCVLHWMCVGAIVGWDIEPNNVVATPASGPQPVEWWCQASKHTHTHTHRHTHYRKSVSHLAWLSPSPSLSFTVLAVVLVLKWPIMWAVWVCMYMCVRMCMRVCL